MNKVKSISALVVVLISLLIINSPNMISAQGADLAMDGLGEAPANEMYDITLNFHTPANVAYLSISLSYDESIFQFDSINSPYLVYDSANSSPGTLRLRASQVNISQGDSILGTVSMKVIRTGNARFTIQSASAFTSDDLIVGIGSSPSLTVAILSADEFIPIPTITQNVSSEINVTTQPTEGSTLSPISSSSEATDISEETSDGEDITSIETTPTSEESSSSTVNVESEAEVSSFETSYETQNSTTQDETSTNSTETSVLTSPSEVTTTSVDNVDDSGESGFRIEMPIIFILLLAAGITTVIISRRK